MKQMRTFERILAAATFAASLGSAGLFAQTPGPALDAVSVVREMNLPGNKVDEALKIVNIFVNGVQDSSRQYAALLQKNGGDLFDPQFQAKSDQIKKGLALKIERFTLDLSDIAGEAVATAVVARYTAAIPRVLLAEPSVAVTPAQAPAGAAPAASAASAAPGAKKPPEVPLGSAMLGMPGMNGVTAPAPKANVPQVPLDPTMSGMPGMSGGAAGGKVPEVALGTDPSLDLAIQGGGSNGSSGGMGMMDMMDMMGGMSGSSSTAPDPAVEQLTAQLNSINGLIDRMIKAMAAPGGASENQMKVLTQLLANQRSLIELLASKAGGSSSGMAPMGMM